MSDIDRNRGKPLMFFLFNCFDIKNNEFRCMACIQYSGKYKIDIPSLIDSIFR